MQESAVRPASVAAAAPVLDDVLQAIAEQKKKMLQDFLRNVPTAASSDVASAPAAAVQEQKQAADRTNISARKESCTSHPESPQAEPSQAMPTESPRAQLVRSFMSELESPREASRDVEAITAMVDPHRGPAAAQSSCSSSEPCVSPKKRKHGRRLRLHEMRVRHVLSCLGRLDLGQYASAFESSGIDGVMCDFLDHDLLKNLLGMQREEHRLRFLQWVAQMQPPPASAAPPGLGRM